jgi:hypothetical protein
MSKLKPIYVTLKETRHKTQPWTFTIDRPGPQKGETKQERYVSMWSAWRGACRVLGLQPEVVSAMQGVYVIEKMKGRYIERPVKRIVIRLPKKRAKDLK